jgi:hypothetical protein
MSSAAPPVEIPIGDHKFQVSRLKVKDSLRGLRLVGKVLLPALAEAHAAPDGHLGGAVARVVEGLDCLPELLDLFVPVTKYFSALGSFAPLAPCVDDVFGGRPDQVVQFLVEVVQLEYGAFLAAGGPLAGLLAMATPTSPTPTPG